MRRTFGILIASSLVLAPIATAANPDAYFWRAACSSGAVIACAKIQVRKVWTSSRTNYVQVRIRNLQGFDPRDNTGGSVFNLVNLAIQGVDPSEYPFFNVPTPGLVGSVGTAGPGSIESPGWTAQYDGVIDFSGFNFWMEDGIAGEPGDGIRGCDLGPQRGTTNWLPMTTANTCALQGFMGWATVGGFREGDPALQWDVTGAAVALHGFTKDGQAFSISFANDQAIVAPEPASIVLLASGLALVGGLAWKRRRAAGQR